MTSAVNDWVLKQALGNEMVLHCWGSKSVGIEKLLKEEPGRHEQPESHLGLKKSIRAVVVPSYWGQRRKAVLAQRLIDFGHNPFMLSVADTLFLLDEPTVQHSAVWEVEPHGICVSVLDWNARAMKSRYLRFPWEIALSEKSTTSISSTAQDVRVETALVATYQMTTSASGQHGLLDPAVIRGEEGLTYYDEFWQQDLEIIVAEHPGPNTFAEEFFKNLPMSAQSESGTQYGPSLIDLAEHSVPNAGYEDILNRLQRREFLTYGFPENDVTRELLLASASTVSLSDAQGIVPHVGVSNLEKGGPVGLSPAVCRLTRSNIALRNPTQFSQAESPVSERKGTHGTAQLENEPLFRRRPVTTAAAGTLGAFLLVGAGALGIELAVQGHQYSTVLSAKESTETTKRAADRGQQHTDSQETTTKSLQDRGIDGAGRSLGKTMAETPNQQKIQKKIAAEPLVEMEHSKAGMTVTASAAFELDESDSNRLVLVMGDRRRIIAVQNPVDIGTTLDDVAAKMISHAAAGGTMHNAQIAEVGGHELVTMEERLPSGKSVVLWHYRVLGNQQLSIGCQYRGTEIPASRPDCTRAVATAKSSWSPN